MAFELPALPYDKNALEPYLSAETLDYHYGKHHHAYVTELNALVADTEHDHKSLEEIIQSTSGRLFNQAAQAWNHTFYWHCLSPNGGGEPQGPLAEAIVAEFGSFDGFKKRFNAHALGHVGAGWTWLIKATDGGLQILNTDNADTPIAHGQTPLLAVDVWEHAYYIDYRNACHKYLEGIWQLINWEFVNQNAS
ncbi:superoxide dismutase [Fe] [Halomonas sp. ML-15]|uniref:superoxide dismutase n=1 Tax=Halomonas sp. ML-15 TaxID=2773305 RepID=UPI00174748C5|nr:Fe-Mn family superoxide dismutase [Halomonas sp. ML-15]MBD3894350.1 superoxide dismutase [Fe] [Halomonas sp. ML-15]